MPFFRVFTGFASRIRSRAAKPATYENLSVFIRSDAHVVRAGWNIRGCGPLSTPGFFDNLCGDGLLPPRSLCQSAMPVVRATAFAEGLGGLSEGEGYRLSPCNGPSFPTCMPPEPEPLGVAASGIHDGWLFATAGGRLFPPLCLSVRLRPPAGAAAGSSAGHFRPADKAAAPPAVQFRSVYASRPYPWHSRRLNSRRNTFTPAPPAYFHPSSGLRPPPPQWPAPVLRYNT